VARDVSGGVVATTVPRSGASSDPETAVGPEVVVPSIAQASPGSRLPRRSASRKAALLDAFIQALVIASLIAVYEILRVVVKGDRVAAFRHATSVWNLERTLHLPNEAHLERPLLHHATAAKVINFYYASAHFPMIALAMAWLCFFYRPLFSRVRDVLVVLTVFALILCATYPLAPPRLLPAQDGVVDLARRFGFSVYSKDPDTDKVANQFAAMPSLHVAYAALVAIAVILAFKSRWRWLAILYPIATTGVVLVTGNHYWLDAIVGLLLLGLATLVTLPLERRRRTPLSAPGGVLRHEESGAAPASGPLG
jgi:membrane-associated phospholipid phosphatase